jgi:hypothetical protein
VYLLLDLAELLNLHSMSLVSADMCYALQLLTGLESSCGNDGHDAQSVSRIEMTSDVIKDAGSQSLYAAIKSVERHLHL